MDPYLCDDLLGVTGMQYTPFCEDMTHLTLKLLIATHGPFADSVDQDQTAQNVQSDLGSTLSDKKIFLSKN